ncbi:MAG TPA: 2OG-Fe(II) oxygenase [Thermoanaerobaculia bacterium]|nr:2OG-Fe(II) oxygenase [Thermoanaerobaculia bacterium]
MPDLMILGEFLDAPARERILRDLRTAAGSAAPVYGAEPDGAVDSRVRRARIVEVSIEVRELVTRLLASAEDALARRFGLPIHTFESPQFLHYVAGDFFVAHQDGNTGMIRDDAEGRRISAVIFLNAPSGPQEGSYGGGSLVLHGSYPHVAEREIVPAMPGALVAFRSETTHEVTPVTHGDRYTIVTWYRE